MREGKVKLGRKKAEQNRKRREAWEMRDCRYPLRITEAPRAHEFLFAVSPPNITQSVRLCSIKEQGSWIEAPHLPCPIINFPVLYRTQLL